MQSARGFANVWLAGAVALLLVAGCGGNAAPAQTTAPAKSGPTATPAAAVQGIPPLAGTPLQMVSGLGYIDAVVGTGAVAQAGMTVSVHYTGWLADGRKFDSSRDHGQPFSFALGGGEVIRGWDEGVAGMKVGGSRRLIVPAALGYGARGFPPVIPPNAQLVFDVELLSVR